MAVVYRALLILAYGIFELPLDDLQMAANANNIQICTDVKDVFINVIMQIKDQQAFDIALEGLAAVWLKMPQMLQELLNS